MRLLLGYLFQPWKLTNVWMNLTPTEEDILVHLFLRGDDSAANIAEEKDRHRVSVSQRASDLEEKGLVVNKGNGVFQLTNAGLTAARNIMAEDNGS